MTDLAKKLVIKKAVVPTFPDQFYRFITILMSRIFVDRNIL